MPCVLIVRKMLARHECESLLHTDVLDGARVLHVSTASVPDGLLVTGVDEEK